MIMVPLQGISFVESPSNVMLADWAEPIDKLRQRVSLFDRVAQKKRRGKTWQSFPSWFCRCFFIGWWTNSSQRKELRCVRTAQTCLADIFGYKGAPGAEKSCEIKNEKKLLHTKQRRKIKIRKKSVFSWRQVHGTRAAQLYGLSQRRRRKESRKKGEISGFLEDDEHSNNLCLLPFFSLQFPLTRRSTSGTCVLSFNRVARCPGDVTTGSTPRFIPPR